jgi:hypothetical protein
MVLLLLQISSIILRQVSTSLSASNPGQYSTLGSSIFVLGTYTIDIGAIVANTDSTLSVFEKNSTKTEAQLRDEYRYTQIGKQPTYTDYKRVYDDIRLKRYNYLFAIIGAIFAGYIMLTVIFFFVQRLIEIILLYLVSPLFVAVMPLDDGVLFKKWRELFIGKMFACFGTVFTLKLLFIFEPFILGSSLRLSSVTLFDYTMKIIIFFGGMFAAKGSQFMFLQLLSSEAASAAQDSTSQMLGGSIAIIGGLAKQAAGYAGSGGGGGGGDDKGKSEGGSEPGGDTGGDDGGAFTGQ